MENLKCKTSLIKPVHKKHLKPKKNFYLNLAEFVNIGVPVKKVDTDRRMSVTEIDA